MGFTANWESPRTALPSNPKNGEKMSLEASEMTVGVTGEATTVDASLGEPVPTVRITRVQPQGCTFNALPKFSNSEAMSEYLDKSHGIKMDADRLRDLALGGYLPHYEIDGDGPYFHASEIKEFVKDRLTKKKGFKEFPDKLTVLGTEPPSLDLAEIPYKLLPMAHQLFDMPSGQLEKAGVVYFLIKGREVVYVGQSTNLISRIGTHLTEKAGEFNRVLYMFVPIPSLIDVETQFIRALNPRLNWPERTEKKKLKLAKIENGRPLSSKNSP
jgi:hypothetical protein